MLALFTLVIVIRAGTQSSGYYWLAMIRFATVFVLLMAGNAVAGTDLQCVSDCSALKNPKEFCVSQCSYKDDTKQSQPVNLKLQTPKVPQANPQCLKTCTAEGSPSQFCQQLCSH